MRALAIPLALGLALGLAYAASPVTRPPGEHAEFEMICRPRVAADGSDPDRVVQPLACHIVDDGTPFSIPVDNSISSESDSAQRDRDWSVVAEALVVLVGTWFRVSRW